MIDDACACASQLDTALDVIGHDVVGQRESGRLADGNASEGIIEYSIGFDGDSIHADSLDAVFCAVADDVPATTTVVPWTLMPSPPVS